MFRPRSLAAKRAGRSPRASRAARRCESLAATARRGNEQERCLIGSENRAGIELPAPVQGVNFVWTSLGCLQDCREDSPNLEAFASSPWRVSCSTPGGPPAAFAGACRIPYAVTNSSLHRVNPTVVSTSDNEDLFAAYGRHRAYDEMFGRSGEVRAHCLPLLRRTARRLARAARRAAARGRQGVSHPGHHVHGLRRRAGHRADLPVRPGPSPDHGAGMADARARPDPAAHGHQPVPEGRLPRGTDPRGGRRSRASWSRAAGISGARCAACRCRATSTCRWPAPISSAARTAASSSSKTTCACRAACPTCSRTAR